MYKVLGGLKLHFPPIQSNPPKYSKNQRNKKGDKRQLWGCPKGQNSKFWEAIAGALHAAAENNRCALKLEGCWGWKCKAGGRRRKRKEEIYRWWRNVDTKLVGVREEDAEPKLRWRLMIGWGDPWREQPKGKWRWQIFLNIVFVFWRRRAEQF